MGHGSWSSRTFTDYVTTTKAMTVDELTGSITGSYSVQDNFKSKAIDAALNPKNVIRESCDSEEHPNSFPVILALDVTGSMGAAAMEVAKKINVVMTGLYEEIPDVQFMIMGIGDLAYDYAPIQASQFESDIRIAEQLDKVYFEGGGGGNGYESYTAAWYFGLRHTNLDCWNRGKKGIIITMGDEPLNPYLPQNKLMMSVGDNLQGDIETGDLYREASEKFDIYHLAVNDKETMYRHYKDGIERSWSKYLDNDHLKVVTLDNIAPAIIDIVKRSNENCGSMSVEHTSFINENGNISW